MAEPPIRASSNAEVLIPQIADRYQKPAGDLARTLHKTDADRARPELSRIPGPLKVVPSDNQIELYNQTGRLEAALLRAVGARSTAGNYGSGGRIDRSPKLTFVGRLRRPRYKPAPLRGFAGSNLHHRQTKTGPTRGPILRLVAGAGLTVRGRSRLSADYVGLGTNLRRFAASQVQTFTIAKRKRAPQGGPFFVW